MPIKDIKTPLTPTATPDTLSDIASSADLGPLPADQALKIRLCELRIENKFLPIVGDLQSKVATLKAQCKSVLIELRDKIQTLRLEDILKVLLGLLASLLIHNISQNKLNAFFVHIANQTGHPFRSNPSTDSDLIRPLPLGLIGAAVALDYTFPYGYPP